MIKIRASIGFLVLAVGCVLTHNVFVLFNYLLALVLHEYSHFLVARMKGYELQYVALGVGGMSIRLKTEINRNDEFWIAVAGPLCNVVLCVVCSSLWWLVPETYFYTREFFNVNIILAIFNVLPVHPLDGSRILNSLLVRKYSTKKSVTIQRVCSIAFGVIFVTMFIVSCFYSANVYFLIFALLFFCGTNADFGYKNVKTDKTRKIYDIKSFYVNANCTLLEAYKCIDNDFYSIFWYKNYRLTENDILSLVQSHHFDEKICDICQKNC